MKIFNVVVDKYDYLIEAKNKEEALNEAQRKYAGENANLSLDSDKVAVQATTAKKRFDYALKQLLIKGACFLPGKKLSEDEKENGFGRWLESKKNGKKRYDRYLSEKVTMLFNTELFDTEIYDAYVNAQGNEFSTGKFYSVASSSRFVVSSFSECDEHGKIKPITKIGDKKIECLDFEHPCPVVFKDTKISEPQLDATFKIDSDQYFIEAKCHEIFDSHKSLYLKEIYKEPLGELILNNMTNEHIKPCSLESGKIDKDTYIGKCEKGKAFELLTSEDFGVGRNSTHFDFKQFLCHLMGIISFHKTNAEVPIKFYYLFYGYDNNNKTTDKNFDFGKTYCELEKELSAVAEAFAPVFEANNIEFGYLYNDKFDTLTADKWKDKKVLYPLPPKESK